MKHRGRIQLQGEKLEESESWSQNEAITKDEGLEMLENLKKHLNKKELKLREGIFKKAVRFIKNGSYKVIQNIISKTFMVQNTAHERLDIEIQKGEAFTNKK